MTVLSQTFFTLVGSHLMAFSFFSAGHCKKLLMVNNSLIVSSFDGMSGFVSIKVLEVFHEHFRGLEGGNLMLGNDDGGVLGNVAGGLL